MQTIIMEDCEGLQLLAIVLGRKELIHEAVEGDDPQLFRVQFVLHDLYTANTSQHYNNNKIATGLMNSLQLLWGNCF